MSMRPEDISIWLRQQPFQPFRLVLSNGTTYEVRHPELAMVGRSVLTLGLPAPDFKIPVFDRQVDVALVHINTVEPVPVTTSPPSNN